MHSQHPQHRNKPPPHTHTHPHRARRGTVVFRVRDGASMAKWISLIREFLDISFVVNINRILIGSGEEGPGGTVVTGA